jgi:RNA recognition motif-containing protein
MNTNTNNSNIKHKAAELNASTVLMVSNISRNVSKIHLQEIFSPYGELKGVYVPRHEETKLQKSYVFLEYGNQENAEKAMLYFSGGQIDGLIVKVEILNPDSLINKTFIAGNLHILQNKNKNQKEENFSINTQLAHKEKDKDDYDNENDEIHKNYENLNEEKKRVRSRSRSRKRSRSNSNSRYRRDNYKYSQGYSNNHYGYGGSRRYQDFNERSRRKYKRKDSKSSGKSSNRSSNRSSRSSS